MSAKPIDTRIVTSRNGAPAAGSQPPSGCVFRASWTLARAGYSTSPEWREAAHIIAEDVARIERIDADRNTKPKEKDQ